jgi:DNA modification methylase
VKPYYEHAGSTIYHGRCEDVLPTLPDASVGLVLSDLPYGVTANGWDRALDWSWLWGAYGRVAREDAAILLFGQDAFTAEMICSNRPWYRYSLVWEHDRATGFLDARRKPLRSHQDIAVFYRRQPTYAPQYWRGEPQHGRGRPSRMQSSNYGAYRSLTGSPGNTEKLPRTVLYFPTPHPKVHPNEKPVALLEYLIRTYSRPGDVVLDNCAGSGSTLAAALRAGRNAIGIDTSEEYCEIAVRRLQQGVLDFGAEVPA